MFSPELSGLKNPKLLLFYIRRADITYPTRYAMLGDNVVGKFFRRPIQVIRKFTIFKKADVWEDIAGNMATNGLAKTCHQFYELLPPHFMDFMFLGQWL